MHCGEISVNVIKKADIELKWHLLLTDAGPAAALKVRKQDNHPEWLPEAPTTRSDSSHLTFGYQSFGFIKFCLWHLKKQVFFCMGELLTDIWYAHIFQKLPK